MVSLVMMALAFGVPKPPCLGQPPCSGPAQNVTSGKLALTFHAFLKACIHKFSSLTISCESQFAMAAEYLKNRYNGSLLVDLQLEFRDLDDCHRDEQCECGIQSLELNVPQGLLVASCYQHALGSRPVERPEQIVGYVE